MELPHCHAVNMGLNSRILDVSLFDYTQFMEYQMKLNNDTLQQSKITRQFIFK
ncbi:MAG: hypothetical protein K0U24_04015 [Gammaproteobacteria bacterium]|nr:hypothetical protein [Gammaproteobacteria bacterium]MCH9763380.1 hypothetical protein [Gammaproteobacteria bacterium]